MSQPTGSDVDKSVAKYKELCSKRSSIKGQIIKFKNYLSSLSSIQLTSHELAKLTLKLTKFEGLSTNFDLLQTEIEVINSQNLDHELNERDSIEHDIISCMATAKGIIDEAAIQSDESLTSPEPDHVTANNSVERPVQIPGEKRRCQRPVELAETRAQMNTALTALNKALNKPKENEREDECDLYGRLLAYKLKSYSSVERQALMYEIDGLLLKKRNRVIVSGLPSQIILSRPSSKRTMYTNFPRPSSTNSNYYSNSPHAVSIDSVNSPPEISIPESPSAMYVSQPLSPQTMFETNYAMQSQDILSQACNAGRVFENNN
ncbi:hypothetical protein ACJJTC_009620 [Scirpophaga incertulas]